MLRHTAVQRRQQVIVRETGPWAAAVHALLRHLEAVGFAGAPRVVGTGFDPDGRETLTFIEGEIMHPGQRSVEAAAAVGTLLRELHQATATFRPPSAAPCGRDARDEGVRGAVGHGLEGAQCCLAAPAPRRAAACARVTSRLAAAAGPGRKPD